MAIGNEAARLLDSICEYRLSADRRGIPGLVPKERPSVEENRLMVGVDIVVGIVSMGVAFYHYCKRDVPNATYFMVWACWFLLAGLLLR